MYTNYGTAALQEQKSGGDRANTGFADANSLAAGRTCATPVLQALLTLYLPAF